MLDGKTVIDAADNRRGADRRVGLEPAYAGDEDATGTVDALLPLWFAMVKPNGGNRKVALGIIR